MKCLARALLVIALTLLACGDPTTSHFCSYNSDCPDDGPRYCVNGVCQSAECEADRDCDDGQICLEGTCTDG